MLNIREKSSDRTSHLLLQADEDLGICKHSLKDLDFIFRSKAHKSHFSIKLLKKRDKLLAKNVDFNFGEITLLGPMKKKKKNELLDFYYIC